MEAVPPYDQNAYSYWFSVNIRKATIQCSDNFRLASDPRKNRLEAHCDDDGNWTNNFKQQRCFPRDLLRFFEKILLFSECKSTLDHTQVRQWKNHLSLRDSNKDGSVDVIMKPCE